MFSLLKKYITNYRELEYLAYNDILTGTYNRNWLIKNITNIKCEFVYFIDINNLHKINNKSGHVSGDEVIIYVANKLKCTGDIVVRYGGDEFIVFSNSKDLIENEPSFSTGVGIVTYSIEDAIKDANINMLINKMKFKNNTV